MPLPEVCCPNCRARMSLDVVLADDGVRDMLMALTEVHPAGDTFIKPLMRYIGLFAPKKTQMTHARMAGLIRELEPELRDAQVKRDGTVYAAPMELWASAFGYAVEMAHQGRLELPLKSHGWLRAVIASQAARAAGQAESATEAQRRGIAGTGTPDARREAPTTRAGPIVLNANLPKREMPNEVREAVKRLKTGRTS
jgi:hypothetical protein